MALNLPPLPNPNEEFAGPIWQKWLKTLTQKVTAVGAITWSSIDFTGSNISDIVTRNHNSLSALQGGAVGDYQHLTTDELNNMKSSQVLLWLSL